MWDRDLYHSRLQDGTTNLQVRHPVLTLGLDFLVLDVFATAAGLSLKTNSTGGDVEKDDEVESAGDIYRGWEDAMRVLEVESRTSWNSEEWLKLFLVRSLTKIQTALCHNGDCRSFPS